MTDTTLPTLPYRPQHPNLAWRNGASARSAGVAYEDCPYTQPGKRREWQAGWEYEDAALARRAALRSPDA